MKLLFASPPRESEPKPAWHAQGCPWFALPDAALPARASTMPEHPAPCFARLYGDALQQSKIDQIAGEHGSRTHRNQADSMRIPRLPVHGCAPPKSKVEATESRPQFQCLFRLSLCCASGSQPRPTAWATCRSCHSLPVQAPMRTPSFSIDSPGCISRSLQLPPPT